VSKGWAHFSLNPKLRGYMRAGMFGWSGIRFNTALSGGGGVDPSKVFGVGLKARGRGQRNAGFVPWDHAGVRRKGTHLCLLGEEKNRRINVKKDLAGEEKGGFRGGTRWGMVGREYL